MQYKKIYIIICKNKYLFFNVKFVFLFYIVLSTKTMCVKNVNFIEKICMDFSASKMYYILTKIFIKIK